MPRQKRTCSIEDCEAPHAARGWCNKHWLRWRRHGDPLGGGVARVRRTEGCVASDCVDLAGFDGLCSRHRRRLRRTGTTSASGRAMPYGDRLLSKVVIANDGCWEWTGAGGSYGSTRNGDRTQVAHRAFYEEFVGPIPVGLTLDHLCRNRRCVRPGHLEPVTNKVNVLRGEGPTAVNARKTHCIHGHEFTPENTYLYSTGRQCRACAIERSRRSYERRKNG